MNYLLFILLSFLLVYFFILVFTYLFQRNLLYHPNENNYSDDKLSVSIEKVKVKTSDNIDLLAWYHVKDLKKYKTILYFHGNAGSLENRIHKLNHFRNMSLNFLIIAWRGFSGNSGKPSEKGLYEDGNSAIKWLLRIPEYWVMAFNPTQRFPRTADTLLIPTLRHRLSTSCYMT